MAASRNQPRRQLLSLCRKAGAFTASIMEPDGTVIALPLAEFVRMAPLSRWRNPRAEIRHVRALHRFMVARVQAPLLTLPEHRGHATALN